ncbi:MAG: hypothetical protein HYY31_02120, partial [Chloroflexi bacterium]|nr:hypothetical protein [Chloroflexota bacterium]
MKGLWRWPLNLGMSFLVGALLVACGGAKEQVSAPAPAPVAAPAPAPQAATPAAAPAATPVPLKVLKTSPESGPVGTPFTVSGEGLPAGKDVQFVWVTWDGSYATKVTANDARFEERKFVAKRVPLKTAVAGDQGQVSVAFTAPEDYGETHDIYAVVDGLDVGKAGFRIIRGATITPTSGPV